MAKIKGQVVPPELQEKFYQIFNNRSDKVVTAQRGRIAGPSEKQRQVRESFIRCSIYWNQLSEQEKANIFNRAQQEGREYYKYFMLQTLKKRIKGEITDYGIKVEVIKTPGPTPTGITYKNDYIYIADSTENSIYKLNLNYEVIEIIDLVNISPQGITIAGENLWVTDGSTDQLYQYKFDGSLVEIKNISNRILGAITIANNIMYIYDQENKEIITYNIDTEQVQEIFKNDKNPIYGLGWDGINLWYSSYQINDEQQVNFNLQGHDLDFDNNVISDLKIIENREFYLSRLSNQNQLVIKQRNIRFFNMCINKDYIYTTDSVLGLGYKIRMVVDMP